MIHGNANGSPLEPPQECGANTTSAYEKRVESRELKTRSPHSYTI